MTFGFFSELYVFRGVEILTLALKKRFISSLLFFSRFVFIFSFNLFMSV